MREIPDSRLVLFPEAGHVPMEALRLFLAPLAPAEKSE
jgi:hypothetical protein